MEEGTDMAVAVADMVMAVWSTAIGTPTGFVATVVAGSTTHMERTKLVILARRLTVIWGVYEYVHRLAVFMGMKSVYILSNCIAITLAKTPKMNTPNEF